MQEPAPYQLLDDGVEREKHELLVIGCGNLLRGDDAAGPILIRRLWQRGAIPEAVQLADGGTSGMDVVFKMQHARRVLIVDASSTGVAPGTVYRVPAEAVENVPPVSGFGSHDFRWDHAIAVSRWLLGPLMPERIEIILIEGAQYDFGGVLSAEVDAAVDRVAALVEREAVAA